MGLRNAARGLGAALVYIGQQGMERQQREEADARLMAREQAMARLRQNIANEDADIDQKRDLVTSDLRDDQLVGRRKSELAVEEPVRVAAEERTERRETRRETRQNREWDRRQQTEFDRWRQQHDITEDTTRARELWRREQGLDTEPVRYLESGETGTYVAVERDGTQRDTGIRYRERAGEDDDLDGEDDLGPEVRGGGASSRRMDGSPAPAGRGGRPVLQASARRNTPPPGFPNARRGADGRWYVEENGRYRPVIE
jgi:hypothetical protein